MLKKLAKNFDKKMIIYATFVVGIMLTLIYIFYTSTAFLNSDSVITDVLAHQQRIHHEFILSNWYYGNEFWLFSLTIPTFLLSFFIKNNLLLRQICVLITAIIFFIILYIYSKEFLKKKDRIILLSIFASGISYSVLDYFYAFNAYLTVIINSMVLLYTYYKIFEKNSNKTIYYILAILFTFMFNVGSLRYLPSVTFPFIITEFIITFIGNYKGKLRKAYNNIRVAKIFGIIMVAIIALIGYCLLINKYNFETRAASGKYIQLTNDTIVENVGSVFECLYNFFGYDNRPHPYKWMIGNKYYYNWHHFYSVYSLAGMFNFIKIIASILFMIVTPIVLFKNYNKNDKNINFLLIFNTISWTIMIYLFIFSEGFFHHYSELKYFLFNIIISIILAIYCIYKYFVTNKNIKFFVDLFIVLYIISNLYQTTMVIAEHNKDVIDKRYELTNTLKENNLTYGYGNFWTGLMTNFLSDYKIEIATVEIRNDISPYKWYADEKLFDKNYHNGKVFLVMDNREYNNYSDSIIQNYGKPNKVLLSGDYYIYVYNKDPFKEILD